MLSRSSKYEKYGKYIMWAGIALLYLLCFKVVLQSGYMFDDMWNNIEIGLAINNDTTVGNIVLGDLKRWTFTNGRLLIFSFYCDFALSYIPLKIYKLLIVTTMFLDALVVSGIVKELSKSKILSYLCVVVFPAMISFRATYYTGVYAFHGLIQLCMFFTLLAVYLYIRYRRTEKIRYQVLSCISWFVALGLYEVSYVLCVCFIIALICIDGWDYVKKNFWKSIKTGLPQIIIMVVWVIFNIVIKMLATGNYDGITPSFNPVKVIVTFLKQCSGGIGFGAAVAELFNGDREFWIDFIRNNIGIAEILSYILFFAAFLFVVLYLKDKEKNKLTGMVWLGVTLVVLPSTLIAISSKYQESIGWFRGYLPAYFGSWGFAIIAAVIVVAIGRKIKSRKMFVWFNIIMAALFTFVFTFDNIVGNYSQRDADAFYQDDVDSVRNSINAGLFDNTGLDYILDTSYSIYALDATYTNRAYAAWLRRKNNVYGWDDVYEDKLNSTKLNELYDTMKNKGFKTTYHINNSYTVLADCNDLILTLDKDEYDYKAYTNSLDIFLYDETPMVLTCKDINGNKVSKDLSGADYISSGKYGKVYHVDFDKDIDMHSIAME